MGGGDEFACLPLSRWEIPLGAVGASALPAARDLRRAVRGRCRRTAAKPRCYAEVYNDLDGDVVNFFRVVRDVATRAQLVEVCALTPYARAEFDLAWEPVAEAVERARRLA